MYDVFERLLNYQTHIYHTHEDSFYNLMLCDVTILLCDIIVYVLKLLFNCSVHMKCFFMDKKQCFVFIKKAYRKLYLFLFTV